MPASHRGETSSSDTSGRNLLGCFIRRVIDVIKFRDLWLQNWYSGHIFERSLRPEYTRATRPSCMIGGNVWRCVWRSSAWVARTCCTALRRVFFRVFFMSLWSVSKAVVSIVELLVLERKVLVLEDPRWPIYKSLSSSFSSNRKSLITTLPVVYNYIAIGLTRGLYHWRSWLQCSTVMYQIRVYSMWKCWLL